MRTIFIFLSLFIFVNNAHSQLASQSNKQVTFENVIEAYAKSSGEKIIVDPRVKGKPITRGLNLDQLSFAEFIAVLHVYNFATYRSADVLVIVPANVVKYKDIPMVTQGVEYAPDEYVSDMILFENGCAAHLSAAIKPFVQPATAFVIDQSSRAIYLTGPYSSAVKIRGMVDSLESRLSSRQKCEVS